MTDGANFESTMRGEVETGRDLQTREALEHTLPDADAYEKFLAGKPNTTPREFFAFLKTQGLNLTESAPAYTGEEMSPIAPTLTDNPKERYVINAMLNRRLAVLEQGDLEEREKGYRPSTPSEGEDIERYYNRVEAMFIAQFCERVVGFKKAAALLETATMLYNLSSRDSAGEPSLRAEAAQVISQTLAKLIKKDVYERGEFLEMLQRNRKALCEEIVERSKSITEEEARTVFAKAFDVDFKTYKEIFPEKL